MPFSMLRSCPYAAHPTGIACGTQQSENKLVWCYRNDCSTTHPVADLLVVIPIHDNYQCIPKRPYLSLHNPFFELNVSCPSLPPASICPQKCRRTCLPRHSSPSVVYSMASTLVQLAPASSCHNSRLQSQPSRPSC